MKVIELSPRWQLLSFCVCDLHKTLTLIFSSCRFTESDEETHVKCVFFCYVNVTISDYCRPCGSISLRRGSFIKKGAKLGNGKKNGNRVLKCDVTNIWTFEIIGFVCIFGKSMMKNAYLPKISILLQFGGEILALLCRDDSIQILELRQN